MEGLPNDPTCYLLEELQFFDELKKTGLNIFRIAKSP